MHLGRGLADRRRRHRVVAVVDWPDLAKLVFGIYKPELVLAKLDVLLVSLGTLQDALPQYIITCRLVSLPILLEGRKVSTQFAKSRPKLF